MIGSMVSFLAGSAFYEKNKPDGSVINRTFKIIYHSYVATSKIKASSISFLDRAKLLTDSDGNFLYENEEVENVKSLTRIIPIFLCFIFYWTLYYQMSSIFYQQGIGMDMEFFLSIKIPVATLNLFDIVAILIFVPLFERIIYPLLERSNIRFGSLKRIFVGNILIIFAMMIAGILECYRLYALSNGESIVQRIGGNQTTYIISAKISILYQIPQYALVGASEILVLITELEFAYDQAPHSMKSLVMSFYLLTSALGSFIAGGIVQLLNFLSFAMFKIKLISDENFNTSNLHYYFTIIAIVGFINIVIYFFIAKKYKFKRLLILQIQSEDD